MTKRTVLLAGVSLALLGGSALAQSQETFGTIELDEIIVSANRAPSEAAKTGSTVLVATAEDLEQAGDIELQDYLARLPGITVSQNGPPGTQSNLRIRGLGLAYIQVRIDGIDISDPTGTQVATNFSNLLVDDIERIEILKGSQSALYGSQAIAGVIDITTKRAAAGEVTQSAHLEGGSYATLNGSYGIAAGFERGEFSLNAQHFKSNGFSAFDEDEYPGAEADGYRNTTLSGRGSFLLTDQVELYSALRYYDTSVEYDNDYSGGANAPVSTDTILFGGRTGAKVAWWDDRVSSDISLQGMQTERKYYTDDVFQFYFKGKRFSIESINTAEITSSLDITVGTNYNKEYAEGTYGLDADMHTAGVFGQIDWSATDVLNMSLAGRLDNHSDFGTYETFRLSAAFNPDYQTTIRSSIGTGFRAPSLYELYDPYAGDSTLEPEESLSFDVGVERSWMSERLSTSIGYFYIETENLIINDAGTAYKYVQVPGTSTSQGVETSAQFTVNDYLALTADYTYTWAVNSDDERLARVPRHDVGLGAVIEPTDNWRIALQGNYVADTLANDGTDLEDYFLLNGNVAYEFDEGPELYVRAENILDQDYQTAKGYGTAGFSVYAGVRAQF
ncbi:TonB-dependent receptor plug domain-containing protein [Pseudovibrio exalbescens]|uniref:TonB-dependent receptor plug domain-containing protein n=1 Tax=Pseudovibrio exalbescens TaxID=197461 RepID=UPI000C9B6363|nr:TonB-dependent receptor [Pseudovibrio exalbescens]